MNIAELPVGDAPEPLKIPHFPTRWQCVLWRNFGLVPHETLAQVLRCSTFQLLQAAEDLGLDINAAVCDSFRKKSYLSLIRRNWHLLPYDQIAELLEIDADRINDILEREDFFWSKMGKHKPSAEAVYYADLDENALMCTREIKDLTEKYFPIGQSSYIEAPLAFMDQYAPQKNVLKNKTTSFDFNLIHSCAAGCGDIFADIEKSDPIPEYLLRSYASLGVNGVWMHGLLRHFYPVKGIAEYSKDSAKRLANLRLIAKRCRKYGVGLYLYFNEPRFMPSEFYDRFPHWRGWGLPEYDWETVCTTRSGEVLEYLEEGMKHLFSKVPELAGFFCITMSENPTHCNFATASKKFCPYCKDVPDEKIIADIISAMTRGAHAAQKDAKVIAYDWAWRLSKITTDNSEFKKKVVDLLPDDVYIASVSEWGLPLNIPNEDLSLKDYSISRPGPSGESRKVWSYAELKNIPSVAKIQINNSWELSAVPYIPVPYLIHEHLENLRRADVRGLILSWTQGGFPGGNLKLLNASPEEIARASFREELAEKVCRIWRIFSDAFREFPFHNSSVLYRAPQNYGPSNLLSLEKSGYAATMMGFPYDDIDSWRGPFTAEYLEEQFRRLTEKWCAGLEELQRGAMPQTDEEIAEYRELEIMAQSSYCHLRSAYLEIRFVNSRNNGFDRRVMLECLHEEIDLALKLHDIVRRDSRIGFEQSNHYYYSLNDLKEKVISTLFLIRKLND